MRAFNLLYGLFFIGWGDIIMHLTPTMIKFLILALVVAPTAIGMLHKDDQAKTPSKTDILLTMIFSLLFVWFGYLISEQFKIPSVVCLIACFFLGLYSLPIVIKSRKHILNGVGGLIDSGFNGLKGTFDSIFKKSKK